MKIKALMGIMGMDQHEVGAIVVARILRDAGIEVVYVGRFNTPSTILRSAVAEAVDFIALSCHSWEYLKFVPELISLLRKEDADIGVVVGGSVITPKDAQELLNSGVDAVFGSDSTSETIVNGIQEMCTRRRLMM